MWLCDYVTKIYLIMLEANLKIEFESRNEQQRK